MERCPNLKMISVAFTGVDHVDMDYCRERGILVSNCAGYSNTAVSELVFGLALSLYRRIIECDRAVRAGKDKTGLVGLELAGKTFGIIGMGAIGTRTAQLAKAFGCRVLGFNRSPKQVEGVRMVELDELLRESDIASLHVPLTEQTRGMIGEREIGLMKPSAILINTARGPVVDSAALAAALKEGGLPERLWMCMRRSLPSRRIIRCFRLPMWRRLPMWHLQRRKPCIRGRSSCLTTWPDIWTESRRM